MTELSLRRYVACAAVVCGCALVAILTACTGNEPVCSETFADGGSDDHSDPDGSAGSVTDEDLCPSEGDPNPTPGKSLADGFDFTVDPDDLIPPAPGAMPPAIPSFDMLTGEPILNKWPPATPAVIAWSDWCFFGTDGDAPGATAFACSQQIAHFVWALTPAEQGGIAADEPCVLEQERLYLETMAAAGTLPAQALQTNGWHRCASVVDPSPGDGRTMIDKCLALAAARPQLQARLDVFYGGDCATWADAQQHLMDAFGAPACSEAARLSMLWRQSVLSDAEMQRVAHVSLC